MTGNQDRSDRSENRQTPRADAVELIRQIEAPRTTGARASRSGCSSPPGKEAGSPSGRDIGSVRQPLIAALQITIEDLVAGLARNPELPAQIRHRLGGELASHELESLIRLPNTPSTTFTPSRKVAKV
jgi:hypothetical protein